VVQAGRLFAGTGLNLRWLHRHLLRFRQGVRAALQLRLQPILVEITALQVARQFSMYCVQTAVEAVLVLEAPLVRQTIF
jgi:hypothetical protein